MPATDGAPTEREYQEQLTDLLTVLQWRWFHIYPLQTAHGWRTPTTAKGIPDVIAVRGAYTVAIEVKSDRGAVGAEQLVWLRDWSYLAGGRAWLLRPRDDFQTIVGWLRNPADAPRVHGFDRP